MMTWVFIRTSVATEVADDIFPLFAHCVRAEFADDFSIAECFSR